MLIALIIGVMASQSAFAGGRGRGHGHGHARGGVSFGLFVGVPLVAYSLSRPYYAPAYYYPPVVYPSVYPAPLPPVYIEQGALPASQPYTHSAPRSEPQPAQAWWYYCAESETYYPYVRQCPAGWERVSPQPPN